MKTTKIISKKMSRVMKKISKNFRKEKVTYGTIVESEKRSMPSKHDSMLTESAVWRSDIEKLCQEFDVREEFVKNSPERKMVWNVSLDTSEIYRIGKLPTLQNYSCLSDDDM